MSKVNETDPIDDLIRTVQSAPTADLAEQRALDAARDRLNTTINEPRANAERRSRRRARPLPAGIVSITITCGVALLVAAIAITALGGRGSSAPQATLRGPAAGPGANALIAKLAVLRRPQTVADQLPANLHITIFGQPQSPTIIPSLSRLVATPPGAKIYLVVTDPVRGGEALWSPALGDQLNILAITSSGATTLGAGYPAADIRDPMNVYRAGLRLPGGPGTLAQRIADAYDVAIVPDGVARVRWTFTTRTGGTGPVVTVRVRNNVAITKLTPATAAPLRTTWYAANGRIVPTSSEARTRALADRNASQRRTALAAARHSHVIAAPAILHAFAVFDFDSRSPVRIGNGYSVSHPTLSQLPPTLLPGGLGQRQQLDLRDVRKIVAPTGETLYVVPGVNTICLFVVGELTHLPYGRTSAGGSSGGCAGTLARAISQGAGESSSATNMKGSTVYAVVPRTTHDYKLQTGRHTYRIIQPIDGIVVAHTPFQFG